jgi:hypothetical protein
MTTQLHLHLVRYQNRHLHAFDDAVRMIRGAAEELQIPCTVGYQPGAGTNIVIGSNMLAVAQIQAPTGAIIYTCEQHAPGSQWAFPYQIDHLRRNTLWSYDPVVSQRLAAHGLSPRLVPVGHCDAWETLPKVEEDIDVAFFGSPMPYRNDILMRLRREGLNVCTDPAYGPARDALYARAKVCLSLASYTPAILQSLRVGYLLANRRCVLSDPFLSPELYPYGSSIEVAHPEHIASRCRQLVNDPHLRASIAERGYAAFKASRFRDALAAALAAALEPSPSAITIDDVARAALVPGTREITIRTTNRKVPIFLLSFLLTNLFWKIAIQDENAIVIRKLF